MTAHTEEDVEQGKHSSTASGSANLYNHFGHQYGSFLENWEFIYLKTQLYHSWAYTQRMDAPPQEHLYNYVDSSFIYNIQKVETT